MVMIWTNNIFWCLLFTIIFLNFALATSLSILQDETIPPSNDFRNETASYDMTSQCIEDHCSILDDAVINLPFNHSYAIRLTSVYPSDFISININNLSLDQQTTQAFQRSRLLRHVSQFPLLAASSLLPQQIFDDDKDANYVPPQNQNPAPISVLLLDDQQYANFRNRTHTSPPRQKASTFGSNELTDSTQLSPQYIDPSISQLTPPKGTDFHKNNIWAKSPKLFYPNQDLSDLHFDIQQFFVLGHSEVNVVFFNENEQFLDQYCPYSIGLRFHGFGCLYELGFLSLLITIIVSLYITSKRVRNFLDKHIFYSCWCCWWDSYNTKYQEAAHRSWRMRRQEYWLHSLSYHQAEQRVEYELATQTTYSQYLNQPLVPSSLSASSDDNTTFDPESQHQPQQQNETNLDPFAIPLTPPLQPQNSQHPLPPPPPPPNTYMSAFPRLAAPYQQSTLHPLQRQDSVLSTTNQNTNYPSPSVHTNELVFPRFPSNATIFARNKYIRSTSSLSNNSKRTTMFDKPTFGLPRSSTRPMDIVSPLPPFISQIVIQDDIAAEVDQDMSMFTPHHIRTALAPHNILCPDPKIHQSLDFIHQLATTMIPVSFVDPIYYNNFTVSSYSPMFLDSLSEYDPSSTYSLQFIVGSMYGDAPLPLSEQYFYPHMLSGEYNNNFQQHLQHQGQEGLGAPDLSFDTNDHPITRPQQPHHDDLSSHVRINITDSSTFSSSATTATTSSTSIATATPTISNNNQPHNFTLKPTPNNPKNQRQPFTAGHIQHLPAPIIANQSFFYNFGANNNKMQRDSTIAQFEAQIRKDFQHLMHNQKEMHDYYEESTDIDPEKQRAQLMAAMQHFNPQTWKLDQGAMLAIKGLQATYQQSERLVKNTGKFVENSSKTIGKTLIKAANPLNWSDMMVRNGDQSVSPQIAQQMPEQIDQLLAEQQQDPLSEATTSLNDLNNTVTSITPTSNPAHLPFVGRERLFTLHEENDEDDERLPYNLFSFEQPTTATTTTTPTTPTPTPDLYFDSNPSNNDVDYTDNNFPVSADGEFVGDDGVENNDVSISVPQQNSSSQQLQESHVSSQQASSSSHYSSRNPFGIDPRLWLQAEKQEQSLEDHTTRRHITTTSSTHSTASPSLKQSQNSSHESSGKTISQHSRTNASSTQHSRTSSRHSSCTPYGNRISSEQVENTINALGQLELSTGNRISGKNKAQNPFMTHSVTSSSHHSRSRTSSRAPSPISSRSSSQSSTEQQLQTPTLNNQNPANINDVSNLNLFTPDLQTTSPLQQHNHRRAQSRHEYAFYDIVTSPNNDPLADFVELQPLEVFDVAKTARMANNQQLDSSHHYQQDLFTGVPMLPPNTDFLDESNQLPTMYPANDRSTTVNNQQQSNQLGGAAINVPTTNSTINKTTDPIQLYKDQLKTHTKQQEFLFDDLQKNYQLFKTKQRAAVAAAATTPTNSRVPSTPTQTSIRVTTNPQVSPVSSPKHIALTPTQANHTRQLSTTAPHSTTNTTNTYNQSRGRRASQQIQLDPLHSHKNDHISPKSNKIHTPLFGPTSSTMIDQSIPIDLLNDNSLDPFKIATYNVDGDVDIGETGDFNNPELDLGDDNRDSHDQEYLITYAGSINLQAQKEAHERQQLQKKTHDAISAAPNPFDIDIDSTSLLDPSSSVGYQSEITPSNDIDMCLDIPMDVELEAMLEQIKQQEEENIEMKQLLEYGFVIGNTVIKNRINNNVKHYVARSFDYQHPLSTDPNSISILSYQDDDPTVQNSLLQNSLRYQQQQQQESQHEPQFSPSVQSTNDVQREYLYIGDLSVVYDAIIGRIPTIQKGHYNDITRAPQEQVNLHYNYAYTNIPSRLDFLFHTPTPKLSGYSRLYEEIPWCLLCCNYKPYTRSRPPRVTMSHPFSWFDYDRIRNGLIKEHFDDRFQINTANHSPTSSSSPKKTAGKQVGKSSETKLKKGPHVVKQGKKYYTSYNDEEDGKSNTENSNGDDLDALYANYAAHQNYLDGFQIYDHPVEDQQNKQQFTSEELYSHAIHHHFRHQRGCCFIRSHYRLDHDKKTTTTISTSIKPTPPIESVFTQHNNLAGTTLDELGNVDPLSTTNNPAEIQASSPKNGFAGVDLKPHWYQTHKKHIADTLGQLNLLSEDDEDVNTGKKNAIKLSQYDDSEDFIGDNDNNAANTTNDKTFFQGMEQWFDTTLKDGIIQRLLKWIAPYWLYRNPTQGNEHFDLAYDHGHYTHLMDRNSLGLSLNNRDNRDAKKLSSDHDLHDYSDDFFGRPLCYCPSGCSLFASLFQTNTARYEQLYCAWRKATIQQINLNPRGYKRVDMDELQSKEEQERLEHLDELQKQQESLISRAQISQTHSSVKTSTNIPTDNIKTAFDQTNIDSIFNSTTPTATTTTNTATIPANTNTTVVDNFHITINSKIDVVVHSTIDQDTNRDALYLTRAINVRQASNGLYIMIPPPHILDVYHLPSMEGDKHKYQWGWYYNSANNFYSIRDDETLPSYLRLHDLQQWQKLQERDFEEEHDSILARHRSDIKAADKRYKARFSNLNVNNEEEQEPQDEEEVENNTSGDSAGNATSSNPSSSPRDNINDLSLNSPNNIRNDNTADQEEEEEEEIAERPIKFKPVCPPSKYEEITFSDTDILKFDPKLYHINIVTDFRSYFDEFVCTNYLPEGLAAITVPLTDRTFNGSSDPTKASLPSTPTLLSTAPTAANDNSLTSNHYFTPGVLIGGAMTSTHLDFASQYDQSYPQEIYSTPMSPQHEISLSATSSSLQHPRVQGSTVHSGSATSTSAAISSTCSISHTKQIIYHVVSAAPNPDPLYHLYRDMYQKRLLRLLKKYTNIFPHLRRSLTPSSHPVEILKHLSAPVHTIRLSKSDEDSIFNSRHSQPSSNNTSTDVRTTTTTPPTHTETMDINVAGKIPEVPSVSPILPNVFTYDTSKYLYPPAPVKPGILTNFFFNLLPSTNWTRLPQISHKIDCVETYCARPRVDWSHFWRSRIIYTYPFNPGYDEDLMHFRHRLILVFAIVIFNLCIFISFSGALERVVDNLLYIVSATPLVRTKLDWVAFWLTANFAQSFVIVMSSPFLAFAMFDCERFKRSYQAHIRVLGWTIYLFLVVTGLLLFGGALFAFGLVLYTNRCDFVIESVSTFFFSSHLFSISCTWGIPLPILYVLMNLYGAIPRHVDVSEKRKDGVTEPRPHLELTNYGEYSGGGFKPIIDTNDAVQGIDLHSIKRLFIQAGVAIADYNGEMVMKAARGEDFS